MTPGAGSLNPDFDFFAFARTIKTYTIKFYYSGLSHFLRRFEIV